jgi:hypothetical protein
MVETMFDYLSILVQQNEDLFWNAEVIGNVVGAFLAFLLGIITLTITQGFSRRSRKVQITYSKK